MSTATSTRASAAMTVFGEVELRFPCAGSEDLRDALKSEIPARFRRWDGDEKRWLILGAYAPAAIDLLLEHFPNAETPADRVRPARLKARTARPPTPLPLPAIGSPQDEAAPQPERDHLVASVRCPTCHQRYDQPVRVVAESSARATKRERATPELVSVCPHCHAIVIVAFYPRAA